MTELTSQTDPTTHRSQQSVHTPHSTTVTKHKRTHWDTSRYLDQDVTSSNHNTSPDCRRGIDEDIDDLVEDDDGEDMVCMKGSNAAELTARTSGSRSDTTAIETITHEILSNTLQHVRYDPDTCRLHSQRLAGRIMEAIKSFGIRHYKYVTVVSIGSLRERPGMHFGSRCLWDEGMDSFATVKYTNESLFAVAMLYGLHFD
jgi:hypothetical protein